MHQLLPLAGPGEPVDPVTAYLSAVRPAPEGRPWVTLGMIASVDGATALDGRSGGLGGPADRAVFRAVRAVADVVLVGAGTVRTERYSPVQFSDEVTDARRRAGRSVVPPRLAVVSTSLDLDPTLPLFARADPERRPLVLTTDDAPRARRRTLEAVADVHALGATTLDVVAALALLAELGNEVVVCEGGPTLNGALIDAGTIDEVCLTLSPVLAGGDSDRVAVARTEVPVGLALASLLTADDMVFGRWMRA